MFGFNGKVTHNSLNCQLCGFKLVIKSEDCAFFYLERRRKRAFMRAIISFIANGRLTKSSAPAFSPLTMSAGEPDWVQMITGIFAEAGLWFNMSIMWSPDPFSIAMSIKIRE